MEIEPNKLYGVVSGDIVGSSKLDPLEREALFQIMREGSQVVREWLGAMMPLEIDIFGGDSWQFLVTDVGKTLAAALLFRAHLLGCSVNRDTRIAVGIGSIDFVPRTNVSEGDGEAFRLSGRLLEDHRNKSRMRFASIDPTSSLQWDLAFALVDTVVARCWTEKRSLAVTGALRDWRQDDIRNLWNPPISQPTVKRHLDAAGWPAIARAIGEFERFWTADCKL